MSPNLSAAVRRVGRSIRGHPGRGAAALVLVVLIVGTFAVVQSRRGGEPGTDGTGSSATAAAGAPATGSIGGTRSGPEGAVPGTAPGASDRQPGAGTVGSSDGAAPGDQPGAGVSAGGGSGGGTGSGGQAPVPPRPPVRCASTGPPRAGPLPSADERDGRRWVTVGRLAGNCDASSPPFRLQGILTRLAWRSDADSFAVFVVDASRGRDATAGFADGECAGSCSESQPIVPAAGSYTLEVQAGDAPWEVEVQEYRSP